MESMENMDTRLMTEVDELPHLLEELSFSYLMVYSAQKSLDDLDRSIKELGDLVGHLQEKLD
jgi:NTP pyrophosphatase (non-canonical NTP hydrolase)